MNIEVLRKASLFEGMTVVQLQKLAKILVEVRYPSGATIFKEGVPGSSLFVIEEGKVRISKIIPEVGEEALAILEKGQYFGEMSLIDEATRSAEATAQTSCVLYELNRERLDQLMFVDKDFACVLLWMFVRTLSSRLRKTNEKLRSFFALSTYGES